MSPAQATQPTLLYLDTSALIRLYSDEPHREQVLQERASAGGVIAHDITYVELRAGLAGRLARKLLRKSDYARALSAFESDWQTFAHISISQRLLQLAGTLAAEHTLKAYDAVHLAAAYSLLPLGLRFMTFDQQLQRVAIHVLSGNVWHSPT